ncbi:MAG TPA: glycosyl hydrolase 108 family protein [Steroidobacteraceae bacterium]|nr:glycosyl hydrolase 108 family protein [Steroidobacteraceae bacterium]
MERYVDRVQDCLEEIAQAGLMSAFDEAFRVVIGHEGGLVDDPRDAGGLTKYGISQRQYPGEDIRNLTLERAKELYRRDYWARVRGDELPFPAALALFDYAVNSGVETAIRGAQKALNLKVDGILGPITFAAIDNAEPEDFVSALQAERLLYLARLTSWDTFGRGWARRIVKTAIEAFA